MAATSTLPVIQNRRPTKFYQKTIAPKPSMTTNNSMTLTMKTKNSKANTKNNTVVSNSSQSDNSVSSSVSTTTLLHNRISGAMTNRGGRKNSTGMIPHPTLGYPVLPPQPAKVQRRNARERNRVKQVNCGFDHLRSHIPSAAKHKKMSKVDTLRHAVDYIQNLQKMLSSTEESGNPCVVVTSPGSPMSRASPDNSEAIPKQKSPSPLSSNDIFEANKMQTKLEPKFEDSTDLTQHNKPPPLSFHGQPQHHHQQSSLSSSNHQMQYTTNTFIPNQQQHPNHSSQHNHSYPLTPRTPNSPESGFVESTSGYETASNAYSNYMNYSAHSPNTHLMHPGQVHSSPDMPSLIMPTMTDGSHHHTSYPPNNTSSNNVNTLLLPGASSNTFQHHPSMGRLNDGRANSASPTSPSIYSDHSSAFINSSNIMHQQQLQNHQPIQQHQQLIELVPSVIGHHNTNIDHHNNEINSYFKYTERNIYNSYGETEVASDEDDILDAIAKWQES